MKLTYDQALEAVEKFVAQENEFYQLVRAFAETNDMWQATAITADMYHQASEGVTDFNMSVQEYVIEMLDQQEKLLAPDRYENESDAANEGRYWFDELEKWIKLDF